MPSHQHLNVSNHGLLSFLKTRKYTFFSKFLSILIMLLLLFMQRFTYKCFLVMFTCSSEFPNQFSIKIWSLPMILYISQALNGVVIRASHVNDYLSILTWCPVFRTGCEYIECSQTCSNIAVILTWRWFVVTNFYPWFYVTG